MEPTICNTIIVKQDAQFDTYANDAVDPINMDGESMTSVIKAPCAIGRSSTTLRSVILDQNFHKLSDYCIKGLEASSYLKLRPMLMGTDTCNDKSILPKGIIGANVMRDEPTIQLNTEHTCSIWSCRILSCFCSRARYSCRTLNCSSSSFRFFSL